MANFAARFGKLDFGRAIFIARSYCSDFLAQATRGYDIVRLCVVELLSDCSEFSLILWWKGTKVALFEFFWR